MAGNWIMNALNVFGIGFNSVKNTSSRLFGLAKKYVISQFETSVPFEQGYAKNSDVFSINRYIVTRGSAIPWILKKRTFSIKGDTIETITSSKQTKLFNLVQNPNSKQTRQQYVTEALTHLQLGGNVFMYTPEMIGIANDETILLHPQLTTIKTVLDGRQIVPMDYEYRIGGKTFHTDPNKITHIKYCNPTDFGITTLRGLSPLTAGALTMIGSNNNQTAQASILDNQSTAGILSNEGEYFLQKEEQEEQQKLMDGRMGDAETFGHILQSHAKVKYIKLGLDSSQMKIIESRILYKRDLCDIWDVDSILFGDPVGSTFNNIIEAKKSVYTGPIKSNLGMVMDGFTLEVVSKFNEKEFPTGQAEYFLELDWDSVEELQKDKKEEAAKDKLVQEGIKIILAHPISSEAKKKMLMEEYDFSEDYAEIIVRPEGVKNKTLEVLKSVSPLLATKLIDSLTEEEVKALFK